MIEEQFWAKVDASGDCWTWTGKNDKGYGTFSPAVNGTRRAHRIAYELLVGPVPKALELDHLCRNRPCVNPDHLEPVTPRINKLRSFTPLALNARKTHCVHGHEFTPENTRIEPRGRDCLMCARLRNRIRNRKRRVVRRDQRRLLRQLSEVPSDAR